MLTNAYTLFFLKEEGISTIAADYFFEPNCLRLTVISPFVMSRESSTTPPTAHPKS